MDISSPQAGDVRWSWLYRIGGVAALLMVATIPIAIVAYIVSPPPSDVIGFFNLFRDSTLMGLLALDLMLIISVVLTIPVNLALYVALRQVNESFMTIATAFALVGAASYFASNTAFNMLSLSSKYAAAATDAERAVFLAAGEAMLTIYTGTAFHVNYIIGTLALLIISFVMLRSDIFGKAIAYVGIVSNTMAFTLYIPKIGVFLSIVSVVGLLAWYVMIALKFFQLANFGRKTHLI